ncbi:Alpha/Beta hydrolase protein [Hypoxylon trugodes]|uniref:Alpha/Beta hydrolase protein n=1 Tax=Hypoxylon trugodes TaxID=326681 RepID=UPI00219C84E8|nr:Alpha/Beta hydrolase protein [Hypoxylon trugodes]KAI1385718.1 Alpha/Beta hydrolase protein [Hypoxylon trugodes]
MSPGLSGIKRHFLDNFAEMFQQAGFAAVAHDHRNWGESDGLPRHHTNHNEQIQDTHDVDPSRIALWGSSFSGGIVLIAGAIDPRIKAVIGQVPFISGSHVRSRLPKELLPRIYADRGETTFLNPTYIPTFPESLEEARAQPGKAIMSTEES